MNLPSPGLVLALALALALASCLCASVPALAADKSAFGPRAVKLPSGPGSIEGVGENVEPNFTLGQASYGVAIAVPSGCRTIVHRYDAANRELASAEEALSRNYSGEFQPTAAMPEDLSSFAQSLAGDGINKKEALGVFRACLVQALHGVVKCPLGIQKFNEGGLAPAIGKVDYFANALGLLQHVDFN